MKNELIKTFIVTKYTFVEIYKSKILINIVMLGFFLLLVSFVATEFTFGAPQKVAIDFGLGILSIAAVAIAIFMGVSLVSKEIENRTVYMILSRPISRGAFLVGRILGMSGILFLNILILGVMSISFYLYLGGEFSSMIIWSLLFSFLEAQIVLLVVIIFSLMTNTVMSVIYTILIYVVGHAISDTLASSFVKHSLITQKLLKAYSFIFPNFSKINVKDYIIYNQTIDSSYLWNAFFYGVVYSLALFFICTILFRKKSLD